MHRDASASAIIDNTAAISTTPIIADISGDSPADISGSGAHNSDI
jgi:hypothetical protein